MLKYDRVKLGTAMNSVPIKISQNVTDKSLVYFLSEDEFQALTDAVINYFLEANGGEKVVKQKDIDGQTFIPGTEPNKEEIKTEFYKEQENGEIELPKYELTPESAQIQSPMPAPEPKPMSQMTLDDFLKGK